MLKKSVPLGVLFLSLSLAGCNDGFESRFSSVESRDNGLTRDAISSLSSERMMARPATAMVSSSSSDSPPENIQQRKIAESQHWLFELKSDALESVWIEHRDICLAMGQDCEVVQASIASRGPGEGSRSGSIEMRVNHAALSRFLGDIESVGISPIETNITREDKTLQWVDLQSRLQNAKNLRDRLQVMLKEADQQHSLSDLLAIETELNRIQSTIDSMESQSRVMAQQTDKVRMNYRYRSAPDTVARDIWDPIRYAWHNMSNTFSNSLGEVMLFLAALIPWLLIMVPGLLIGRWSVGKLFRRWFKNP